MIGFLPLPINTEHKVDVLGLEVPSLAFYAATANLSIPLVLTLVVWFSYHVEGIRAKGFFRYLASWLPPGLENMNIFGKAFFFVIEAISHFARLISLSVRLFANILAGHLLLLFMGGGLAVLLGIAALGLAHVPARVRLLHPRGRPDRHPAGVHLLDLDSHLPRRRDRRGSLEKEHHDMDRHLASHRAGREEVDVWPTDHRRPASRSRSASAPDSARSAPASASGSSSARRSSRSPASRR